MFLFQRCRNILAIVLVFMGLITVAGIVGAVLAVTGVLRSQS